MAAVCGTSGIASLFSQAAFAADSDIADGQTQRFDFSILQSMAHDLAQTAWRGAPRPLPDTLATMTPQAYNSIQYDAEKSLWHNVENRQLDAQFFHMGMGFRRRVRMFSVDPATHLAREIHFRPELFKYNDAGVDTKQLEGQSDLGFAGFRVFKAPELARRDVVSFLGASYFRAVDDTYQYGLSARGLAIDTYTDSKEEFPDFTAFWFDTVKPGATTFTVYALLDSASITGAYKFTIHCEKSQVIMDVENHLYADPNECKAIADLGVDMLAAGIGNIHGKYPANWPGLSFETLAAVKEKVGDMPLVLHGGTGIPEDMIKKAISLGVAKINVNTECQLAFAEATRQYIEAGKDQQGKGFDPRKLLAPGFEAIKETVKTKMELFGSIGKA